MKALANAVVLGTAAVSFAQVYEENLSPEHPAILYRGTPSADPVARLARELEKGARELDFHEGGLSYLPSLLDQLGVSAGSQVLVFSKSSVQEARISPRNPRAIYFGDEVAIGYVPGGEVIELAGIDPGNGARFYTLSTERSSAPRFLRPEGCLHCHQGPATLGIPGTYVGSVSTSSSGRVDFGRGTIVSDHRTPFGDRWGGWFVDGDLGGLRHGGNRLAMDPVFATYSEPRRDLDSLRYLSSWSDVVALMTLEHQTQMSNLLTRLSWEVRIGAPEEKLAARIEQVADFMLFVDEVPLPGPLRGRSGFAETFSRRGPRDKRGRSLRDFDLKERLFRYPLSYMIYSESFHALPEEIRKRLLERLHGILSGEELSSRYRKLGAADRLAILEILRDTKPDLPARWRSSQRE